MEELEAIPIDGTEGATMPFFSQDSQWLGFLANGKLTKVSVSGGAPVTVSTTGQNVRGASWTPDGSVILTLGTTNLEGSLLGSFFT